eukprot:467326_1
MGLIKSLTPYSRTINNTNNKKNAGNVSNWFASIIKIRKLQYIVSVFEGGRIYDDENEKSVLTESVELKDIRTKKLPKVPTLHKFKRWLENLQTALDNYFWMIKNKIINNNNINDIKKLFITQKGFESFLLQG